MAIASSISREDEGQSLQIARLLLEVGADPTNASDNNGSFPLSYACTQGSLSHVEFLLANGRDVNRRREDGRACIHMAAYEAQPETIMLLQHGANVNDVTDNL